MQQTFVVTAQGLLTKPEEFENIIIRTAKEGTAIVRVRDIGRVELAKRDYSIASRMNGKTATTIGIYQQPGANAVETARAVRARLEELKKQFPTGLDYKVTLDTSLFTLNSIDKVVHTFFEAVVLVILVVYIFLQSLRATIIPILAVPVSIVGTFIGMHLLGFSINMLTMFGMILAIGLVVDDAIVVVENVEVNMTKHGLGALEAAKQAMSEIAGALISIVLVLVAVFLPVAFLGGVTGTLYQQFAITIAISVVISGVMALTLSPALAAIIIKAHHGEKKGFFRWFENGFNRLTSGYVGGVARLIQGWPVALLLFGAMIAGILVMFRVLPGSFVPDEDQGYFFIVVETPDTSSQSYVGALTEKIEKILAAEPAVGDVATVNGYSLVDGTFRNNAAILFPSMKPFEERTDPSQLTFSVLPRLNRQFAQLKEGFVFAINPPSIPGLGTTGGFEFYIQNRGAGDTRATSQAVQAYVAAARQRPELAGVNTTFRGATQQLFVDLDRSKAEVLGVPVQDAFQTMQSFFGSSIAGQFSQFSRVWWVVIQADASYRVNPDDFNKVFVRSKTGNMVPLSGLITVQLRRRAEAAGTVQRLPGGEDHRQPGAGLQLGPGARGDGGGCPRDAPRRFLVRVGRPGAAGEAGGRYLCHRLRRRPDRRVPAAGGAVREVDPADRGGADGADRDPRRAAAYLGARPRERRVFPGRAGNARRAVGEERDPDLRVRDRAGAPRHGGEGRRHRGGRPAAARDRDDLARVRPRLRAARARERSRRKQPARDRHRRDRRDSRLDRRRGLLRAAFLLDAREHERAVRREKASAGGCTRRRSAGGRSARQAGGRLTCAGSRLRRSSPRSSPVAWSVPTTRGRRPRARTSGASTIRRRPTSRTRVGGSSSTTRR